MGYIRAKTGTSTWTRATHVRLKTAANVWTRMKGVWIKLSSGWYRVFYDSVPEANVLPTISGTAATSSITGFRLYTTLTGDKGTWTSSNGTITYAYQWYRGDSPTGTFTTIAGATGTTYTTVLADNGKYIIFRVVATNNSGGNVASSNGYDQVIKNRPVNVDVYIDNLLPYIGLTLNAVSHWNSATDTIPDSYTYQWYNSSGAISGATSSSYTVQSSDNGKTIYVVVTAINTGAPSGVSVTSASTNAVTAPIPVNVTKPYAVLQSGTANQVGAVYRLYAGTWTNSPSSFDYYLDKQDAGGTNVFNATNQANSYYDWTVTSDYQGKKLDFRVIAYNSYPNGASISAYSSSALGPFTYPAPTVISNPSISGTGAYNSKIYFGSGSYNYGTVTSTALLGSTTSYFGGVQGAFSTTSPYTISASDVSSPADQFATRDTVLGYNGTTYYFYSGGYSTTGSNTVLISAGYGSIQSYELTGTTPTLSSVTTASAGFSFSITNYDSTATYTLSVSSTTSNTTPSITRNGQNVTIANMSNNSSATISVSAKLPGYTLQSASITGTPYITPGAFSYSVSDSTATPSWPSGAGISISGSTSNVMTVTWNSASNATSYADQVSGIFNSSLFNTGTSTSDTWSYSKSGNESATVYAYNATTQATISWGASANAASYYYYYSVGSTYYDGYTTATSITFATAGLKVTVVGVSAWSDVNGGGNGTGGTLSGSNNVTPTSKSTSATGGPFALTYTPAGVSPVGVSPVGVSPVGVSPVGVSPVGVSPVGVSPVFPVSTFPGGVPVSPVGVIPVGGVSPVGVSPVGVSPVGVSPVGVSPVFPVGVIPVGGVSPVGVSPVGVSPVGGGGGCFAYGTQVLLSDNTLTNIENLTIGQTVKAAVIPTYPNGENIVKWYPASAWSLTDPFETTIEDTTVTNIRHIVEDHYYLINGTTKVTQEHFLFTGVDNVWQFVQTRDLEVGNMLMDSQNNEIEITSIERVEKMVMVVDIDVETNDLFYADGYIVHNAKAI
jgi:hypothetical protein